MTRDRRPAGDDLSRQQHRMGRARHRGAGTTGHDGAAGAAADFRGGRLPAADRLRERREPDPRAALEPARARSRVRAALGAGRLQIVRQVLAESFVLSGDRRRARAVRRLGRRPLRARAARRQPAADAGGPARRRRAAVRARRLGRSSRSCSGSCRRCRRRAPALRDTMNAFCGHDRAIRIAAARRARRRRGRARADAARRRRPDDAQLRAVDARVAGLRAAQPAGGADLSAAGEVQDRRSTARVSTWTPSIASGRCRACESAAGVSALPMYPVGIDFALPFTVEGQAAPHQRRGAARRHPHGHARLLRDDEDGAAQGAVHRRARSRRARPARW